MKKIPIFLIGLCFILSGCFLGNEKPGIVKTFSSIENETKNDLDALDAKNESADVSRADLKGKPRQVYEEAKKMVSHIDNIKAKTYSLLLNGPGSKISEDVYKEGHFLIGLDSMKTLVGISDDKVNSKLMIGNPNNPSVSPDADGNNYTAIVLRDQLIAYRELVLETASEFENSQIFIQKVEETYHFTKQEDVKGEEEEWTVHNFYRVPLAATTAKLTTLQAQVMSTANELVSLALNQ